MKNHQKDLRILVSLQSLIWKESGTGLRLSLISIVLLVLAIAALTTITPLFFKYLIDRLVVSPGEIPVLLIAAYIGALSLAKLGSELRWRVYGRIEQRLRRRLALRIFDHVHALSLRFHLERRTGALQQVVGNGLLGYCLILQNALYVVVPLVFEILLMAGVVTALGKPVFLAILVATAVLYLAVTVKGVDRQQVAQREASAAQVEAAGVIADSYLNYETIKYFGCEPVIRERLDQTLKRGEDGWIRYYGRRATTGLTQIVFLVTALSATLVLAAFDMTKGAMTVGDFVLVVSYLLQLLRPLEGFGLAYREIKTGITYIEQMLDLMDERCEVRVISGALALAPGAGEVEFDQVYFHYQANHPVLQDISFRLSPGRTLAVVGPTGAGKSTLSRLLFRFYDVTGGVIKIDGVPLQALTPESLREAIAVVPQDVVLFNDSLSFNIGIAKPGCSPREIEAAAQLAGIAGFIASLPEGYDTLVGERGLKLSGGERQRIAIARAVLKRPRIFIFDEATSSLDNITEHLIRQNIEELTQSVTTVFITHRLATVTTADEILVLVDGRVVERGDHAALLAQGGVYTAMWQRQQSEPEGSDLQIEDHGNTC